MTFRKVKSLTDQVVTFIVESTTYRNPTRTLGEGVFRTPICKWTNKPGLRDPSFEPLPTLNTKIQNGRSKITLSTLLSEENLIDYGQQRV